MLIQNSEKNIQIETTSIVLNKSSKYQLKSITLLSNTKSKYKFDLFKKYKIDVFINDFNN